MAKKKRKNLKPGTGENKKGDKDEQIKMFAERYAEILWEQIQYNHRNKRKQ